MTKNTQVIVKKKFPFMDHEELFKKRKIQKEGEEEEGALT